MGSVADPNGPPRWNRLRSELPSLAATTAEWSGQTCKLSNTSPVPVVALHHSIPRSTGTTPLKKQTGVNGPDARAKGATEMNGSVDTTEPELIPTYSRRAISAYQPGYHLKSLAMTSDRN